MLFWLKFGLCGWVNLSPQVGLRRLTLRNCFFTIKTAEVWRVFFLFLHAYTIDKHAGTIKTVVN